MNGVQQKNSLRQASGHAYRITTNGGFSLIEIILVIVIIGITIPPILTLFTQNLTDSTESEVYTKATLYAEERMEEILGDKRAASAGYGWSFILQSGQYPTDAPETGFTRSVSIDATGNSYGGVTYAEIVVTVSNASINDVVLTAWATNYE